MDHDEYVGVDGLLGVMKNKLTDARNSEVLAQMNTPLD